MTPAISTAPGSPHRVANEAIPAMMGTGKETGKKPGKEPGKEPGKKTG